MGDMEMSRGDEGIDVIDVWIDTPSTDGEC